MKETRSLKARRNSIYIFLLSALCFKCFAAQTEIVYLSGEGRDDAIAWEFFCSDGRNSGTWTTIPVPSNWEFHGFGNYNYGGDTRKSNEQGKYRKSFNVPQAWENKRIFIVFEGVMTDTKVSINGQSAGPVHQGGFYRFKYEITDKVKTGNNLLEATVSKVSSNRSVEQAERQSDYWVFGGIYRPVYLEIVPNQFIEWMAIDAQANGSFLIDVHLNGEHSADTISAQITQLDGTKISDIFSAKIIPGNDKVTLTTKVSSPKLWSAEKPYLYQVHVKLLNNESEIHSVSENFGFRTFEVRPGNGLYLNGQKIRLKGVNRHSFRPDSGRCLSREISYEDVRLIKQMNMNAVRMSHYPPDEHFLDACDELGLYVLDELAGWQRPSYDTKVGKKLLKEMVTRDVSRPCILFWDNANEGGWNTELDGEFAIYDPQKRVVLHPWEYFGGIDTDHYESYESTIRKLNSNNIFMPTEFLHGLYDGGHGAGLKDYWDAMYASPMGAGGFLWVFADEGAVRTDRNGQIDVAGNLAPDGILGPYHEKEASFYTIKDIWSPVQIALEKIPIDFDGKIELENRYDFTNLNECNFEIRFGQFPGPYDKSTEANITFRQLISGIDVEPHSSGTYVLSLPESEVFYLTATNPSGNEIWTWSWYVPQTEHYSQKYIKTEIANTSVVKFTETDAEINIQAENISLSFDKSNGFLSDVTINGEEVEFGAGPKLIGGNSTITNISCSQVSETVKINVEYEGNMNYAHWTIYKTGWIELDYEFELEGQFNLFGVNFDYPETKMRSMRWLGRGPYRVWKNRMRGGRLGVYNNKYKDHTPGTTWDFPEFRGYYLDWRWVVFETEDSDIAIVNGTEDLYLGVYRPNDGQAPRNTALVDVPETGIALLHGIPAIGTKFLAPEQLGPQGQKNQASGKYNGTVYIKFGN